MTDPKQTSEEKSLAERNQEPYVVMDKMDESEIIEELKGAYLEGMVYEYKIAGRTVTGVSYMGIKEIAYQLPLRSGREISTELISVHESDTHWTVVMRGIHEGIGSRIGTVVQAKNHASGKPNPFAYTIAFSKAQRNAIRAVLPELSIQQFIAEARSSGKIKDVTSTQESSRWKNDRGFWTCNDTGITELETPIPDKVSDALEDAGVDPSALRMGTYGDEPVLFLPNVNTKINPYKKVLKEITDPSKFEYCVGNLSSHWFPVDKE